MVNSISIFPPFIEIKQLVEVWSELHTEVLKLVTLLESIIIIFKVEKETGVNGRTTVNHIELPVLVKVWTDDSSWVVERE